jgi:serine/threonine protein kinase
MTRKVFLSCVTKEFGPHRDKLAHDLQMPNVKVEWQESFVETGHTTLDKLDGYIQGCNEVIHIVGFAAGSIALSPEVASLLKKYPDLIERVSCLKEPLAQDPPPITYTQWEAWLAIYHGVPCYVYRAEPSAPRAPGFVEDSEQKRFQEEHWKRLESAGKDRGTFQDEQHLCRLVLRGLYLPPELEADQTFDHEALIQRLPLPLAQLCRRALNAKTPMDRHRTAYDLWEAGLKLLGAVTIVAYAQRVVDERLVPGAQLAECLQNLTRPTLEHWWELMRRLAPVLADAGDAGFGPVRDLLLGRKRKDLPRAARLDAALCAALDGQGGARDSVYLAELFDRLIRYRHQELGRIAAGRRSDDFHDRMAQALLAGVCEVLGRLDVLAGHRLLYFEDVSRQSNGECLAERSELIGESGRRIESSIVPASGALPRQKCVYLAVVGPPAPLRSLHPLVIYDAEAVEVLFLNARRGRERTEFLGYTTGRTLDRPDLGDERRELVGRILGLAVSAEQAALWAARSQAGEPTGELDGAEPSRSIGEFEVLGRLGQGGMGVVYRVWQPSLGRQVALKCMLRAGDPKAAARFLREIRALGRVDHPNVVKVFTSGTQGDHWYYAMELIEGAELSRVCDQLADSRAAEIDEGRWGRAVTTACEQARSQETQLGANQVKPVRPVISPRASPTSPGAPMGGSGHVRQVVEIVRQIADAAHALHEVGVVHRDIKPGNIMLTAAGAHPVLMDLGLAQLADETEGRLTRTRQFVGTLRYASPEQVLAAGQVDRRTDVYSLGATLWELLTLQPIFSATDDTPTPDLMLKIQTIDPHSPRQANRNVPGDLEAIVLKCLEKDRSRRYRTAAELADDLKRWLTGEPVLAHRQTFGYRLGKRLAKHRRMVVAGTVAALLLIPAWLCLAVAGFPVPGSRSVQQWLDRHEASVFRPAPSEAQLKAAAAEQRRVLRQYLLQKVKSNNGWSSQKKERADAWSQMQVTTALLSTSEADPEQMRECISVLDRIFEENDVCDPFIPGLGWPSVTDRCVSSDATGWALSALAKTLSAPGMVSPAQRTRLLERLDQVQTALDNYRSLDTQSKQPSGGWNIFAQQDDPSQANIYVTAIVCQGLLDLRRADLPWHKSREERDKLLGQTVDWLLHRFEGRGWSARSTVEEQFNDGLTSQILSTLLLAEADGQVRLPDAVLDQIPRHVAECGTLPLEHKSPPALFSVPFRNHLGQAVTMSRPIRQLWHPWTISCTTSWLRRCDRSGAPHDEIVRTRRALGHLVLTLGPGAVAEAQQGYIYVSAETLIGLAALDSP